MSSIIKVNTYQDANGNALFSSDGSGNVTLSASGMQNTPAFHAQKTSNQSISNDTETLVSFDTKLFDTDNAFDNSSTYRFTPQTAGKYYIYFNMRLNTSTDFEVNEIRVQKNGSTIAEKTWRQFYFDGKYIGVVVDLNGSSDYVNVDFYQSSGGSLDISGISNITYFGGYRLIGV